MKREQLRNLIHQMRLGCMERVLDAELDRAEREGTPSAEVLFRLLTEQAAEWRQKSLAYRLAQARLPWRWTLQSFPFERQSGVNQAQIHTLAGLDFVKRAENLLLIGPPGTGKTGLAIGLLREACLNGYRGCFYNAQDLLDEIYASLADRSTSRLLQTLSRRTPMVIDELGYMSLKPEQINAFFRLMDQRYNRATTIITTNLEPTSWYELFQNKSLVDALLDRLQHHCITIRINGPSLRSAEPVPAPIANATAPAVARRPTKRPAR